MELLNTIARNDLRRFTELLDSGVDPNTVFNPEDGVYINPLINAVYFLRPQMFTILLERGANPYHADGLGSTAFDYIRILRRGMPLLGGEIAPLSDTQRRKLNLIAYTLSEWEDGSLPLATLADQARDVPTAQQRFADQIKKEIFSPVSDPDSDLIRDDAATRIQRITRGRQTRQRRNLTSKKYGRLDTPVTRREKIRRLLDLKNQFDEKDPIRGYERFAMYPEGILSSSKKGGRKKKKSARKKKSKKKKSGRKK